MPQEFEAQVKENFIQDRLGDRINEIADVDLHFVLPVQVYIKYEKLINEITKNDFNVAAGYNLVLLYTNPEDSQRAGTVLFGRELDGLIAAWSNALDKIATDPGPVSQKDLFARTHAYFRAALCLNKNTKDPCATNNLIYKGKQSKKRNSFMSLFKRTNQGNVH